MKSILRILRNTNQPIASYVWRAWLIALIPSLVIAPIVAYVLRLPGMPEPDHPVLFSVLAVTIGPWIETFLMWPILVILKDFIGQRLWIALASAVAWGVLHGLRGSGWGVGVVWPFFVFSICFLEWEKKSKGRAIIATSLVHTCHNAVPVFLTLLSLMFGDQAPALEAVPSPPPPKTEEAPIRRETPKVQWGPQPQEAPPEPKTPKFQWGK